MTANSVKVHLLDTGKLNAAVTAAALKTDGFDLRGSDGLNVGPWSWGLILSPRPAVICSEAVGVEMDRPDALWHAEVWRNHVKTGEGQTFEMFACGTMGFTLDELRAYLTGDTKTLPEFMGDRYDYNSRLRRNVAVWLHYLA